MSAGLEYLKITSDEVVTYVPTLNSIERIGNFSTNYVPSSTSSDDQVIPETLATLASLQLNVNTFDIFSNIGAKNTIFSTYETGTSVSAPAIDEYDILNITLDTDVKNIILQNGLDSKIVLDSDSISLYNNDTTGIIVQSFSDLTINVDNNLQLGQVALVIDEYKNYTLTEIGDTPPNTYVWTEKSNYLSIRNVATPQNDYDAVNKKYADNLAMSAIMTWQDWE